MKTCFRLLHGTSSRKGQGAWCHLDGRFGRAKSHGGAWTGIRPEVYWAGEGKVAKDLGLKPGFEVEKPFCRVGLCMCQSWGDGFISQ